MKAIYKVFLCLYGGISPSWHRVSWQNKSTHQGMQCVFSSLFRPITKLMWIPACNETNLQTDTQWKWKGIRETTLLINGFKLKTTKSSSCRPAVCFNDCGMGPDVGLSSFSLSNVLGKFIFLKLTIFWVTGRLGPFDPPFSTYVEFWPLLLGSDVEYWPPFFQAL